MLNVFLTTWARGSYFLLIVILLFCYVQLPDNVAIDFDTKGKPVGFIDKQSFFYYTGAIIILMNLLFGLLKKKTSGIAPIEKYVGDVPNWVEAFRASINSYLIFVLLGVFMINRETSQSLDRDYTWFLYFGILLLFGFLVYLPVKFLLSHKNAFN